MPTRRRGDAAPSGTVEVCSFSLSSFLVDSLEELARQEEASLEDVLLTGVLCLLHRYSGGAACPLGVLLDGEGVHCTLRVPFDPEMPFDAFVRDVAKTLKREGGARDGDTGSGSPGQCAAAPGLRPAGKPAVLTSLFLGPCEEGRAPASLSAGGLLLAFALSGETVEGALRFDPGVTDGDAVRRLTGHLQTLLGGAAAYSRCRLGRLPLLTKAERQCLLVDGNQTQQALAWTDLVGRFEACAAAAPDAPALVSENRRVTYGELNRRANAIAHYLRDLEVGRNTPVGICLEPSPGAVVALLGVLKAGGTCLPLDPELTPERLVGIARAASPVAIITRAAWRERLTGVSAWLTCLDTDYGFIHGYGGENPGVEIRPDDLACLLYRGGSSEELSGAACRHEAVVNLVSDLGQRCGVGSSAAWMLSGSLMALPALFEIWTPLCFGGALYIQPRLVRENPATFVAWLGKRGITHAHLPEPVLAELEKGGERLPRLQVVLATWQPGGGALLRRLGDVIPGLRIFSGFGRPELSGWAIVEEVVPQEGGVASHPLTGRPIQNAEAFVLDDCMQPVPAGVFGLLYVGGMVLADGFWNQPGATRERFVRHPFSKDPGARLFGAGVRARYGSDGALELESGPLESLAAEELAQDAPAAPEVPEEVSAAPNLSGSDAFLEARLAGHRQTLAEGLTTHLGTELRHVPMLTADEKHQVLVDWQPAPSAALLPLPLALFEAVAEGRPEASAAAGEGAAYRYGGLNSAANQLAHYLRKMGLTKGERVAVCLPCSTERIMAALGVLKAGGVWVPMDPQYPTPYLEFVMHDAGATALITDEKMLYRLDNPPDNTVCLDADWTHIDQHRPDHPCVPLGPGDLACLSYVSGPDGRPAGISLHHGALAHYGDAVRQVYGLTERDSVLVCGGSRFATPPGFELAVLGAGAACGVLGGQNVPSSEQLLQQCGRSGVTVLEIPADSPVPSDTPPASLRLVSLRGDSFSPVVVEGWCSVLGTRGQVRCVFGPEELGGLAAWGGLSKDLRGEARVALRPVHEIRAYAVDKDRRPLPAEAPGELYLCSPHLAAGYHNRPRWTASRFLPHPDGSGSVLFRSGVRARYEPGGAFTLEGRYDRRVSISGNRLELGQLERLLEQHPDVAAAAVRSWDKTDSAPGLAAYVVPGEKARPGDLPGLLARWLTRWLPEALTPGVIVPLQTLPRGVEGKVDYGALPRPPSAPPLVRAAVTPPDSLAVELAHMYEQVLGIPAVGLHDSFFELGGSPRVTEALLDRIESVYHRRVPLLGFCEAPTASQLARALRREKKAPVWRALRPVQTAGHRAPLFFLAPPRMLPPLAPLLGREQPLYSVNVHAWLEGASPFPVRDLATLAHLCLGETEHLGTGPYCFAAYGPDALPAYEMARQAQAEGRHVALLVLIDPWIPEAPEKEETGARASRRRFTWPGRRHAPERASVPAPAAVKGLEAEVLSPAFAHCLRHYHPEPYSGALTVVLSQGSGIEVLAPWQELAEGPLHIHRLPVTAGKEGGPPPIRVLADQLTACLAEAV